MGKKGWITFEVEVTLREAATLAAVLNKESRSALLRRALETELEWLDDHRLTERLEELQAERQRPARLCRKSNDERRKGRDHEL